MQSLFILILWHLLIDWPTWDADHCIMIVRWMEDPLLAPDLLMTRGWSHWGEDVVSGVNVWPLDWNTQKPGSIVCWRKCGKTVASLRLLTWIKTGLTINNDYLDQNIVTLDVCCLLLACSWKINRDEQDVCGIVQFVSNITWARSDDDVKVKL